MKIDILPSSKVVIDVVVPQNTPLTVTRCENFKRLACIAVEADLFILEAAQSFSAGNHGVVLQKWNMNEDQDRAIPPLGLIRV